MSPLADHGGYFYSLDEMYDVYPFRPKSKSFVSLVDIISSTLILKLRYITVSCPSILYVVTLLQQYK